MSFVSETENRVCESGFSWTAAAAAGLLIIVFCLLGFVESFSAIARSPYCYMAPISSRICFFCTLDVVREVPIDANVYFVNCEVY